MVSEIADFAVIGAGIAGASAAFRLAEYGTVLLLEGESAPGYHTTGRSAALFSERYRNPLIRGLAQASGELLRNPPPGFGDAGLLTDRGLMIVGTASQHEAVRNQFTDEQMRTGIAEELSVAEACELCPVLRPDYLGSARLVPQAKDIDVNALHQGFLRGLAHAGGQLVCNARVQGLTHSGGVWRIETPAGDFQAGVIVNAAGAWADQVGSLAGARPLGLKPKRRTCITFDPPANLAAGVPEWPMVMDAEENFYFKPEAGRILASPGDETDTPPTEAQPEELDVAIAVDRVQTATNLSVQRITHRWAGLRSFLPDKMPVAGLDPAVEGFIWLAGLGGFGIMTSEALGRAAAAAATGSALPADLTAAGIDPSALSPARITSANR